MMSRHTLKLFAVVIAFVAVVASVWSSSAPVDRVGAAPAPLNQVGVAPGAPNASVVLLAQRDAWTDQSAANAKHGADLQLRVGLTGTVAAFNRYTLLGFDLSPLRQA